MSVHEDGVSLWRDAIETAINEAVAAERERCARLVETFDARNDDGEYVTPGLGEWGSCDSSQSDARYFPDADALAAAIRKGD